jgi:hypothetical protein
VVFDATPRAGAFARAGWSNESDLGSAQSKARSGISRAGSIVAMMDVYI